MSTAAKLNVEIDEAILADAELLRDVEAANEYLDEQHEWTPPPAVAKWTLARSQPGRIDHGPAVTLTLTDWPEYGASVAVSEPLTRVHTRGQAYRERAVMKVWTGLLQKRSRTILERVGKALAQMDDDPERTNGE